MQSDGVGDLGDCDQEFVYILWMQWRAKKKRVSGCCVGWIMEEEGAALDPFPHPSSCRISTIGFLTGKALPVSNQ